MLRRIQLAWSRLARRYPRAGVFIPASLYLGVHYFSDVLGGCAVGILGLSTCISGWQIVRRRRLLAPRA